VVFSTNWTQLSTLEESSCIVARIVDWAVLPDCGKEAIHEGTGWRGI